MEKENIREPVELIDKDLDVIAGGDGLDLGIDVNVNIAVIDQLIEQIQVFSSGVASSALASVTVSQTS
jgi:hypothetical protein